MLRSSGRSSSSQAQQNEALPAAAASRACRCAAFWLTGLRRTAAFEAKALGYLEGY